MASRLLRVRTRCSQAPWAARPLASPFTNPRFAQARLASSAVAEQEIDLDEPPVLRLGLDGRPLPADAVLRTDVDSPVAPDEKDPTLFTSLKGKFAYETLKAITVKPMQLTTMTSVQQTVLSLLPDLVDPAPAEGEPISKRKGPDLLVKSKTGTGKTLAFLVPAIEKRVVDVEDSGKRARIDSGLPTDKSMEGQYRRAYARDSIGCLILSPTRELAMQISTEAAKLSTHHKEFEVKLVVGGESKRYQMKGLMKGRKDIVVATPGRMRDLLQSEPTVPRALSRTGMFILDEADTLLDMGFRDDIDFIASYLPPKSDRQTFLFSATISPQIKQIASKYLEPEPDRLFINSATDDVSPVHAHIPQYATVVPDASELITHVLRLIAHDQLTHPMRSKIMVFLPTTKTTTLYADIIRAMSEAFPAQAGTRVREIHSGLTQERRTRISDAFRNDTASASILVTSDVSARGVDYPGVTRVIQIGTPSSTELYIHRVGRTGRAGKQGRGDLVLLPFEGGFVKRQLTEVPMKNLDVATLKAELEDLTLRFDLNPELFLKDATPKVEVPVKKDYKSRNNAVAFARPYKAPYRPRLEGMDTQLTSLVKQLDREAAENAFTSLLGYYVARGQDIGARRDDVLEGLKEWCTAAIGMEEAPHMSRAFLDRLGFNDENNSMSRRPGRTGGGNRFGSSSGGGSRGGGFQPRSSFGSSPRDRPDAWRQREDGLRHDESGGRESTRYGGASSGRYSAYETPAGGKGTQHWVGRGSVRSKSRQW